MMELTLHGAAKYIQIHNSLIFSCFCKSRCTIADGLLFGNGKIVMKVQNAENNKDARSEVSNSSIRVY